ncbi:MAG TPA: hypothetical protein VK447_04245 [Myxococcaceae bacterium]|nr:hypothetical protein [Myxococcaceae bacterium]
MIPVVRGSEPVALTAKRRAQLSRAVLDHKAGRELDYSGYEVAKNDLLNAQHYKCAFCEKDIRKEGNPVEHFRPKAFVDNEDGTPRDGSRYWWLAWTWENLLFACFRCNTTKKRNKFPLEAGTASLPTMTFDLSQERPLLIDPSRVDPRDHIRFKWSKTRGKWLPVAVAGSRLGDKTIRLLGLDEDDAAQRHVGKVEPWVDNLLLYIRHGDVPNARLTWEALLKSFFGKEHAFHALTWDILDTRVPVPVRNKFQLQMPSLGQCRTQPPVPAFLDPPEMAALPDDLQLRVRALGRYASQDESLDVLKDVLSLKTWTDEELGRLFDRGVSTIKTWRKQVAVSAPP